MSCHGVLRGLGSMAGPDGRFESRRDMLKSRGDEGVGRGVGQVLRCMHTVEGRESVREWETETRRQRER